MTLEISAVTTQEKAPSGARALPLAQRDEPVGAISPVPRIQPLDRRRLQSYLALMGADIAAILLGFAAAGFFYLGEFAGVQPMIQAQLILPLFLTIALYNGSYSLDGLQRPFVSLARGLLALAFSAALVTFFAFYTKTGAEFSRIVLSLGLLIAGLLMAFGRDMMRGFVSWRCGQRIENLLVLDDDGPAIDLPDALSMRAADYGLRPDLDDPATLDRIGEALLPMDRVIVSCPPERRERWAMVLKGISVEGEIIDDTVNRLGALGARHIAGQGLLLVSHRPLGLRSRVMKRLLDLAITVPALVVLAIPMLIIAAAIKLEDGGPVFFVQRRMGRANRFFEMLKFRSMRFERSDAEGTQSASRDDDRVTRIGRFIRRTSLDELPQLFNILRGEMSLVGPRPHALGSHAGQKLFWEIDARYWQRHRLKPGLTGLAQVRGLRGATDTEDDLTSRLHSDLQYLDGWSLWRDLAIVAGTARVLVHDRAF